MSLVPHAGSVIANTALQVVKNYAKREAIKAVTKRVMAAGTTAPRRGPRSPPKTPKPAVKHSPDNDVEMDSPQSKNVSHMTKVGRAPQKSIKKRMKKYGRGRKFGRRKAPSKAYKRRSGHRRSRPRHTPFTKVGYQTKSIVTGSISDADCVYLGHSSCNLATFWDCIGQSLIKKYFIDRKVAFNSWDDVPPNQFLITLTTQLLPSTALVTTTFTSTAGNSYLTVGQGLTALLVAKSIGGSRFLNIRFEDTAASIDKTVQPTIYDLIKMEFSFTNTSELSFQNESPSKSAGLLGSTEAIDAVVLEGYHYCGSGNGTTYQDVNRFSGVHLFTNLFGDYGSGVIQKTASEDSTLAFNEPPFKSKFDNVRSAKKFIVNPGIIVKEKIHSRMSGTLYNLCRRLDMNGVIDSRRHNAGKFQFWGLKRAVDTPSYLCTLQYEIMNFSQCAVTKVVIPNTMLKVFPTYAVPVLP